MDKERSDSLLSLNHMAINYKMVILSRLGLVGSVLAY